MTQHAELRPELQAGVDDVLDAPVSAPSPPLALMADERRLILRIVAVICVVCLFCILLSS